MQANFIRDRLAELYPQTEIGIFGMTTRGDQILDTSLSKDRRERIVHQRAGTGIGGRARRYCGAFDEDVPMDMPAGFTLAAIAEREDPRNAFISGQYAGPGHAARPAAW